ncbi:MAG: glycine--tRNA ligase subunit alpha [Buchnera aphidicola (Schlechtendalia peitan)]
MNNVKTFYQIITILKQYWHNQNCIIIQPLDLPIGAGTFHHKTFFGTIGPEPISIAYVQASRRPSDGRYGKNPNRLQHYYQFQVIIKPSLDDIQDIYLKSLQALDINLQTNDIRFIEDNWENPTLGASGQGWEVWINGMEITQFTYFQQMGGFNCDPISTEITYGLERIALHIQNKNNIYDILWDNNQKNITYGDLFFQNELEHSIYNFKHSNIDICSNLFTIHIQEAEKILHLPVPLIFPAYEHVLHGIHYFNLLDAKKNFSTTERQKHILNIRSIIKKIAQAYYIFRKKLNFPLLRYN